MSWALGPLTGLDFESTGVDVETDRIVTACVAHIRPGEQTQVASYLVAVDVDIPQAATDVHGVTTEHARANGKPAAEVLDAVALHLCEAQANGVPVVGMNVCSDLTLLDRELRRHNLPTLDARLGRPVGPVVDVFVVDKALDKFRPGGRKLADLCAHYGVALDGAHDSTVDALAACRVAYQVARRASTPADELAQVYADRRYPMELVRAYHGFAALDLPQLHAAQVRWYAEQSWDFAAYLRKLANQAEHEAKRADERIVANLPAEEFNALVAERDTKLADAGSLRARADGMSGDWPVAPYVEAQP